MSLYDEYQTDDTLENEGTWIEFRGGAKARVRSERSLKARTAAQKIAKSKRHVIFANNGVLPPKDQDETDVRYVVEGLVTDWAGITGRDGSPLPFSRENALKVFTDLPSFRNDVLIAARTDETFRQSAAEQELMAGNSSAPSKSISS